MQMNPAQPPSMAPSCQEQAMSVQQHNFIGAAGIPTESLFDTHFGAVAGFRTIFVAFLNALHQSRRLQAGRFIHQHRHLIAETQARLDARATD
jgi:hypothetical protein